MGCALQHQLLHPKEAGGLTDTELCGSGGGEMFDMSFDTISHLTDKRNVNNLFDFSKAFYTGPCGKRLIKPVNMNISRMGNQAGEMTMMSVGRLSCSLEGG